MNSTNMRTLIGELRGYSPLLLFVLEPAWSPGQRSSITGPEYTSETHLPEDTFGANLALRYLLLRPKVE